MAPFKAKCNLCRREGEWEEKINPAFLNLVHHPKCPHARGWKPIIIDREITENF